MNWYKKGWLFGINCGEWVHSEWENNESDGKRDKVRQLLAIDWYRLWIDSLVMAVTSDGSIGECDCERDCECDFVCDLWMDFL